MANVTVTEEFTSPIPAPRLFKALILEADNLIPKIAPQVIESIEILEGNGGPGTIKQINFAEGRRSKYMKQRMDTLDAENMSYSYTLIEGGPLTDKLEKISFKMKLQSAPDGGTKGKIESTYYPKPGVEIKEEEIKVEKEKAAYLLKAVEAYLLTKPDIYA